MKIQIMGASGAGKTYLGKKLSEYLNIKHVDTDDILWVWDENIVPYTISVTDEDACEALKKHLKENSNLVASGLFYPWAESLIGEFDMLIYITTPIDIRKERIIQREIEMYGNRIDDNGDMKNQFEAFVEWACNYDYHDDKYGSKIESEKFIKKYKCPVIYLNGSDDVNKNIEIILNKIASLL